MGAKFKCARCGSDEIIARKDGCRFYDGYARDESACPMEYRAWWRRALYQLFGVIT